MEDFVREGHDTAVFFVGTEVEHTPAFSKKTLFVVGKQEVAQIEKIAMDNKITHIFLGANHSFDGVAGASYWKSTIIALLDKGLWVSLDYPAYWHEDVLKMLPQSIWQSRLFIPMLYVPIPNVQTSSPNLCIKIDDANFKATNPGVWVWHHHEITDSNKFTDWQDYGNDVIIESEKAPVDGVSVRVDPVSGRKVYKVDVGNLPPQRAEEIVAKAIAEKAASRTKAEATLSDTMGLDPEAPSALKAEPFYEAESGVVVDTEAQAPVAESKIEPQVSVTSDQVADLYTAGTTEDPLAKVAPKKVKPKKTV